MRTPPSSSIHIVCGVVVARMMLEDDTDTDWMAGVAPAPAPSSTEEVMRQRREPAADAEEEEPIKRKPPAALEAFDLASQEKSQEPEDGDRARALRRPGIHIKSMRDLVNSAEAAAASLCDDNEEEAAPLFCRSLLPPRPTIYAAATFASTTARLSTPSISSRAVRPAAIIYPFSSAESQCRGRLHAV